MHMTPVTCLIHNNSLFIHRDGRYIGLVMEVDGEPVIHMFFYAQPQLSFIDLDIIQENWQVMKELDFQGA